MPPLILVTGAAGKTGRHVIQALVARGARVRAWVRTPGHVARLPANVEPFAGDLLDASLWPRALAGVDVLYHIAPNMCAREVELGQMAIAAARRAALGRFVFHSVLHPQAEAMPHHWRKLRVEEALFTSGLTYTILQPTAYMQNLAAQVAVIREEGVLRQPYAPDSRISLVDLRDVAEAAAVVLLEPGHAFAIYELVGTPPLSQHEVAARLSQVLGRPVRAEAIPREVWAQQASGLSDDARATLLKMFAYYERYGMAGNPNVLTWLLGRPPRTLEDWARQAFSRTPG
jgi:uncharacterized protein YbjT (DUF2867 family)